MNADNNDDQFIDSLLDQATSYILRRRRKHTHHTTCSSNGIASLPHNDNDADENEDGTASGTRNPLNFTLPASALTTLAAIQTDRGNDAPIEVKHDVDAKGGRGLFAKRDIRAGERVIVAKPWVLVMDSEYCEEDDDDENGDEDGEGDVFAFLEGDGDGSSSEDGLQHNNEVETDESEEEDALTSPSKKKFKSEGGMTFKTRETSNGKNDCSHSDDHDDEDDDEDEVDALPTGTKRNALIILHLLRLLRHNPALWTETLSQLFPRDEETALQLPLWMCRDPQLGMKIENELEKLASTSVHNSSSSLLFDKNMSKNEEICRQIKLRLPLVVRYNVLSVETSSELFVYPDRENGGMVELAGTGLFGPEVSYLNHSHVPNLSRYAIGDVMFFVANRDIAKGDELCFSYIEHELLCESAERRTALLDMDFREYDDDNNDNGHSNHAVDSKNGKLATKQRSKSRQLESVNNSDNDGNERDMTFPLIESDLQTELMSTPPLERLELLQELLDASMATATNDSREQSIDDYYQCDKHQLRILHAITLDSLGRSADALREWEKCVGFAVENFPPVDENTIALRVQLALCARFLVSQRSNVENQQAEKNKQRKNQENGDCGVIDVEVEDIAQENAKEALRMHDLLFGGGKKRFLKRYEKEFLVKMRMRSDKEVKKDIEVLFGRGEEF